MQAAVLHTAAGGVGLVSLEYARLLAATAHATAGGRTKHTVLHALHQHCSYSSRSGSAFALGALRELRARRCHLVLNSLSGDLTSASFAILGEASSFMEIGKRGVWSHARAGRNEAHRVRLCVLAIDDELSTKPWWMQRQLTVLSARAALV